MKGSTHSLVLFGQLPEPDYGLTPAHKVYLRDAKRGFKLSRVVALTKKQETILKAIDKRLLRAQD